MESVPAAGTWADFWEPTPQDGLPHPALIQGKDTGPAPIRYAMHMAYIWYIYGIYIYICHAYGIYMPCIMAYIWHIYVIYMHMAYIWLGGTEIKNRESCDQDIKWYKIN